MRAFDTVFCDAEASIYVCKDIRYMEKSFLTRHLEPALSLMKGPKKSADETRYSYADTVRTLKRSLRNEDDTLPLYFFPRGLRVLTADYKMLSGLG